VLGFLEASGDVLSINKPTHSLVPDFPPRPGQAAGAGGQAAVPVSPQGQPADVGEAFVSNPPHRGRGGRAHGGVWAGGLTGVRRVRDTS
jgi:hypothetical protein